MNQPRNIGHLQQEAVRWGKKCPKKRENKQRGPELAGDGRKQICHRTLKKWRRKCMQKVAVLLLGSGRPHLNLIITASCKI